MKTSLYGTGFLVSRRQGETLRKIKEEYEEEMIERTSKKSKILKFSEKEKKIISSLDRVSQEQE